VNILEKRAAAYAEGDTFEGDKLLALPVRREEIDLRTGGTAAGIHLREFADHLVSFIDARLGFGCAGFRSAAQPFEFRVYAVFQRLLAFFLRVQIFFLRFQEGAVVSAHAQRAVFIGAIEFHHFIDDVFQKIAVVAYYDARKSSIS